MFKGKHEWGVCPKCGKDDYEVQDWDRFDDYMTHQMYCNECGHRWTEYQKLTYDGYSDDTGEYDADGKCVEAYGDTEGESLDHIDEVEPTVDDFDKLRGEWEKSWEKIATIFGDGFADEDEQIGSAEDKGDQ